MEIHREITPLKENDCFLVFDRKRKEFSFPIHFHPEYEINFIKNATGGKRIIGDHISEINEYELVMVGPNIYHGWENFKNDKSQTLHEITIQFPRDIFDSKLLSKNILTPIKELFRNSNQGILFSKETAIKLEDKLNSLSKKSGFDNFLNFQSILYALSIAKNKRLLTNISFEEQYDFHNSERIEKVYKYVKANYNSKIKVEDAASLVNMTVISFSRLIKQRTGKTFIEFLNELRLGYATRKLIETNDSVTDICFSCGFNNLSNFNRIFKKKQNCTPSEFRINFKGIKNIF
ncbi:transcriptional regulator, AraC family [Formosa agariphila KMM 3901]|uniref:Transcriptional regulator, AraC family n=1 Tax=Formosa agariphila (strain DSM 15362 / KCTC 12365 / LMG 23005 / KMM 3901 / M-2Alg 35-1) TaxID=1347342 RepID=T2KQ20_FORAG|nr:AraC family transcriptional regulator [Formosa agariphila]CDF80810.1 transcriptional regulator, AraC family [Formosa agariphila KMM 3901]